MICGHGLGGGRRCGRRVKQGSCWQHRDKTQTKLSTKQIAPSRQAASSAAIAALSHQSVSSASLQPAPSTASPSRPAGKRRAPAPQPSPSVPAGGSILQDPMALSWLANETRRHTAGNGPGLSPFQIMQNYHGVDALSRLTRPRALPHGVEAVFAGGTCLALGHHLVERYSQDIDIVLVGGSKLSREEREEVLDEIGKIVSSGANLQDKFERRGSHFISKEISYQRTLEPSSTLDAEMFVKTDTGFADDLPQQDITQVPVDTYLSFRGSRPFASHYGDLAIANVKALKPRVTLAEKLIALHQRAAVGSRRGLASRARDIFDIGCLLDDAPTLASLRQTGSTPADIDARQAVRAQSVPQGTQAAQRLNARRPLGGFADSPVWQDGHPMNVALRRAYTSTMSALAYDRSKIPAFDEVMGRVHAHRDLL